MEVEVKRAGVAMLLPARALMLVRGLGMGEMRALRVSLLRVETREEMLEEMREETREEMREETREEMREEMKVEKKRVESPRKVMELMTMDLGTMLVVRAELVRNPRAPQRRLPCSVLTPSVRARTLHLEMQKLHLRLCRV